MSVPKARKILHVDMDAFYASVEQRDRPELRGKPVLVGGRAEGRGVVASCSYEARKFGVRSAMSTRKALQLAPQAVVVPVDMARYKEASRKIRAIFFEVTDLVEPLSLDEAYLDVTENKLGEPLAREVARRIRARIHEDLRLTASAGVGPNKFIAKCASDLRKPDALVVIAPSQVEAFVVRLPVEKIWGVGPATAKKLHALGLRTAGEIQKFPRAQLEHTFGRFGTFLYELAFGRDERPVCVDREPKSCGSETTFDRDVSDLAVLDGTLKELALDLETWLRRKERLGYTVTLKLRYRDFTTVTRSRTLEKATDSAAEIAAVAALLLRENTDAGKTPVRLIGVSLHKFYDPHAPEQLLLDC